MRKRDDNAGILALIPAWNEAATIGAIVAAVRPRLPVLVIDDVGLVGFDRSQANALFQVVNRRYERGSSTIVTTNRSLSSWGEIFGGDQVVAAAVLDRLLHRAVVINIKGPSWRLKEHQALTEAHR